MKKWWFSISLIILPVMIIAVYDMFQSSRHKKYDLIIYGGGPQAVATALKASNITKDKAKILLVVPERAMGSILTVGKQNLFDINYYKVSKPPEGLPANYKGVHAGSFYFFINELSAAFSPKKMETFFANKIGSRKNITVLYEFDLIEVHSKKAADKFQVTSLEIQKMKKNVHRHYVFDDTHKLLKVSAPIFIDASETGRLVRLSGHHVGTSGREDQNPDQLQMAATLMFKLKGVQAGRAVKDWRKEGSLLTEKGSFQLWGGNEMNNRPEFISYNTSFLPFRLKPYNAGEDGYSKKGYTKSAEIEFWMNMLLIYNVDATKATRDRGQRDGMVAVAADGMDPESARDLAITEIKRPQFINMLRKLSGFEKAELIMADGEPEVGEILYIRESIHTANVADKLNRRYEFALDRQGVTGADEKYYNHRIGLGYYQFDSNSYKKGEDLSNPLAKQPWYVPYDVLVSPKLVNVLIPGYAANMDSFSWTAMRVYPNLIMLGDAAGTAAGLAAAGQFDIGRPSEEQMRGLQHHLRQARVILDK